MKKWRQEVGAVSTEYALLIVLIAVGVIFAATFLAGEIAQVFTDVGNRLAGT